MYQITFRVKGDHIAPDFEVTASYNVDNLHDLAVSSMKEFRQAAHYVWKKMESGISIEPRPNKLMSLECYHDGVEVDEMAVFGAIFNLRKRDVG